jgi:hypothetical protein
MSTTFRLEHRFPDISIELFERYLNHPELIGMLSDMPAFRSRDLVEKEELENGQVNWKFRVVAGGKVPPAATKILSEDMLTWFENTRFAADEHCIYWTIEPIKIKDKLNCHGTWKLIPDGEGTRRVIEGTVEIKVRIVGKIAEKFLVEELKKNYDVEPDIQRRFYRMMKEREAKGEV